MRMSVLVWSVYQWMLDFICNSRFSSKWPCNQAISSLNTRVNAFGWWESLYSLFTILIWWCWPCILCFVCISGLISWWCIVKPVTDKVPGLCVLYATFLLYHTRPAKKRYVAYQKTAKRANTVIQSVKCVCFESMLSVFVCKCVVVSPLSTSSNVLPLSSRALCGSGRSYRWRQAREGRSCVQSPSTSSPSPAWCGRSTFSSTEQQMKSNKVSMDSEAHTQTH